MAALQLVFLLGSILLFVGLGVPVFLAMGLTCLLFALFFDIPFMIIAQSYVGGIDSYIFLAIPFFFLAGNLMSAGGITTRLLEFSRALVGHIRGGLSHVNILASMIFSGASGSALADIAAVGSTIVPTMKREGYSAAYSAAVTAASSAIGPLIPPSIPMVIYGMIAGVSVGELFLAGAVPGILMGVCLLVVSAIISARRKYPAYPRATVRHIARSAVNSSLAVIMPLIIVGGIVSGVVTAAESGVLAVAYGLVIGLFVYKEIKIRDLPKIFVQTMIDTSAIAIIIATTGIFTWIIANMGLGEELVRQILQISTNKWIVLSLINLFLLLWGSVLSPLVTLFVFVPVFLPVVTDLGINPVHFGVIVVLNTMIGMVTPPIGILLYVSSKLAEASVGAVIREILPFLAALFVVLVITTFVPQLVLWLPDKLM